MLHLPTDLVIDPVTVDRLARQLAGAPDDVIGVVAPLADLPPGASTRTHAEWCSLLPLDAATDAKVPGGAPSIRGAVLLRAGLESSTGPGTLPAGVLRTDPGAVVHRAEVEPAADVDAASEGRSPFPRRPVVLFLALAGDPLPPDRLQEIERLLDGLLEAEVEPRLAGGGAEVRTRRHRPCAASAATVATLAPDVVVALDAAALTQAPAWCTRRGTVLVDMTGPPSDGDVELVSWQIDRHPTRLRARVSPSVDAAALARLVNRLAAGPQPQPPSDRATDGSVPVSIDSSDSSDLIDPAGPDHPRPRTVVLVEPVGPPGPLLTGLIDRLARSGHEVTHQRDPSAPDAPVVAVLEHGDDPDQLADLGPRGGAVAADPEVVDRLRARGVRAQRVPVMTPVARQRELRAASGAPVASSGGAIGWTRLGRTGPDDSIVAAVTATLLALLGARPDLEVEIVADAGAVPDPLTDHPQVRRVVGRPDPGEQARWSAHVLTPGDDGPPIEIALVEAAHAGVPTLLPVATARAVGGLADPLLVVDEPATPDAWAGPLQLLLAGDDRPARSVWALAAADALEQDAATDLVVARLLGWLDRGATR